MSSTSISSTSTREPLQISPKWNDACPSDLLIIVMGPAGVGKSTFINKANGGRKPDVNPTKSSLYGDTSQVLPYPIYLDDKRIVLVDTPGLDNDLAPGLEDDKICKAIVRWIKMSYRNDMRIAGIVYLYDVSHDSGVISRKPLTVFKQFCHPDMLRNVILATTKWDRVVDGRALPATGNLVGPGVESFQFKNDEESAHKIIRSLINKDPVLPIFGEVKKSRESRAKQGFWARLKFWRNLF